MSLSQAISELNVKSLKSLVPDHFTKNQELELQQKIAALVGSGKSKPLDNDDLARLLELIEQAEKNVDTSGFHKWFQPGTPYGIDRLHKHRELFRATSEYREVLMLGGNRCGKTRAGATIAAVLATGQYPDWWEGRRFNHPVQCWAAGKTGQTVRDTVQEALLGPVGNWGTGAIPADCIGPVRARQGIANAVDTMQVKHVSGGWSTIGFKSYDQKASSFYGTAMHLVWLDEPCPDVVYNEGLIRTMTTNGIVVHTITPKEGLTRLLAEFLSSCDLLAGAERVKGLDAMIKLADMDAETDAYYDETE